jgi:VWFA-related protein
VFKNPGLPRTHCRLRQALFSLSIALGVCVSLSAQSDPPPGSSSSPQSPGPAAQTPVVRVDTRLVVIDVVVTDKHGQPVSGLKKEDFVIKENGKDQTIKAFEAHRPLTQPEAVPKFNLPPHTYTNVPMQAVESSVNIVLFDLMNTPLTDQSYARAQMVQFLKTLPAGQRVALFVLASRLRIISGFTTDSNQLVAAAKKVLPHSSELLTTEDDKQVAEDQITAAQQLNPNAGAGFFDSMRDFLADEEEVRTNMRVETTLNALNSLARGVSGYSGRKNLLWLSEGFPVNFGPDMDAINPLLHTRSYESLLQDTSGLLSSAQMAVYPIDIGGLKTTGVSIQSSGLGASGFRNSRPRYGTMLGRQESDIFATHSAMDEIAKDTGGKAFYNTNDLKSAMSSSVERVTNYYSLAYTPENKALDSTYRHVEIKLDQSGLKTDYRRGYFALPNPNPEKESAQRLVAAMQPGMPDSTMIFFGAQVPPLKPGEQVAALTYVINAQHIAFAEAPDLRKRAKIEMVAVAWDGNGKPAGSVSQTLELALKPETYETIVRQGIRTQMNLQLKPGDYQLRLGIMDDATGKLGTVELPFQVPAPAPAPK